MLKITRKTSLSLAVAAACMLAAPSVFATSLTNTAYGTASTLPSQVADVDVNATTVVSMDATNVNIDSTDLIVGRTTGFSVRLELPAGATFSAIPVPTIGAALPKTGAGAGWTATLLTGGVGTNVVVFSVQPGSGSTGIVSGAALSWAAGAIKLAGVGNLATAGGTVGVKVTFADPNTAAIIMTPFSTDVLSSADALKYSVANSSNMLKKIDVGSSAAPSKTGYSSDGNLNTSPSQSYFEAGTPTIAVVTGMKDATGNSFTWAATDTLNLTVTGTFSAFVQAGASVSLVTAGTCAVPATKITGAVTSSSVTFSGVAYTSLNAGAGILCFQLPASNAAVIDATTIATSAVMTRASSTKTNTATANGLAMAYNGPVAVVYTFNPAGNTVQQSFLRISNTGATGGKVTITGKDDNGVAAAGSVVIPSLAPGKSVQLTSEDLQNGNSAKGLVGSLGAGTGKWIITVTGEIAGMQVTNLNRNNTSGTVGNLGTPVSGAH